MKVFHRKRLTALFALSATLMMTGCNIGGTENKSETEKATIKVMYYDERSFFDQFGMLYSALHPEVEFQIVTQQYNNSEPGKDLEAEMTKFIDENKPDILFLSSEQLTKYGNDGKLLELDSMVEDKKFNKETFIPGLIDYFKELGGGKLYGLTPNYYSQVLYYNKDLFQKYSVDLPTDKMSWEQMLQLAQRFPTTGSKEERVYGLSLGYNSDPYQFGSMIGASSNLNFVNPTTAQVTINTDAWKKTFDLAFKALKSGALHTQDPSAPSATSSYEDYLLQDPFVAGKVAMKLEGNYLIDQIKQAQQQVKDKAIKNWDMVTVPVNPQAPDSSPNVGLSQFFAVSSQSANADAAKEFLQYVMSDEYARVTSKLNRGNLPVRTTYYKDDEGHNMKAFYTLKPTESTIYKNYDKLPSDFLMQFMTIAQQELKSAFDGQITLDDALNNAQTKGQAALLQGQAQQKDKEAAAPASGQASAQSSVQAGVQAEASSSSAEAK
ncbi:extracellular solute-binding protein [Cohnella faecalis]|uniref:Extracellular solute-binding protein n=1 Tax=Cohnella faecalis TaxID=2315694 RepID=A0A398CLV7_9BACL|nr:extracellular solute-binding protein [Cohnella faecalis]